ncbi:MAG: tetratricopeptide repeat protein [Acidobacteriota bacterium]
MLGREADAATLAAALDVDAASLGEIVEELIVRQVLEEPAPEMLRFVHGKIRDVTYDGIDPAARIALHRRAALALETGEGAREEMLSLLGHHWEEAGDPARARACYLPSARRAAREFRNEEAERLYRACIGLSDPRAIETIRVRYELSHKVLAASGRNVEARALATENLAMAREVGDPRSIALGCSALATTIREVGVPAEAIPLYEESARLFRELSDPNEEAQQLANLGLSHQYLGHMDEALRLYESAVEIARRAGLPAREGACLIHVAAILTEIGRTEESFALYQRCLAIFRELGDLRRQAVTLGNFALHLQEVGELDLAIRHNEETLALNRRIGARLAEAVTIGNLAICVEQQGRTAEARDLYEKALAIHRQIGDRRHEGITLNNLATLHHTLGELDVAEALFAQAMAIHRELGNRRSEGITFGNLGDLRADRGDLEGARKDLAAALAIHDEVDDVVGRGGMLFRMARVDRLMGGTTDDTLAQVDRAETILRQADQKLDLVQCLCERGHQLLARGRSGKDALELARATAERVKLGSGSAPARSIASLARCVDAFEAGAPLEHGEVPGDDGVRG